MIVDAELGLVQCERCDGSGVDPDTDRVCPDSGGVAEWAATVAESGGGDPAVAGSDREAAADTASGRPRRDDGVSRSGAACGGRQRQPGRGPGRDIAADVDVVLPTPTVGNATGTNERRGGERGAELLLPGVAVAYATGDLLPTPTTYDAKDDAHLPLHVDHPNLAAEAAVRVLPTPNASDATGGGADPASRVGHSNQVIDAVLTPDLWGKYGPAIRRWEQVVGRAPSPTEPNKNGRQRLNAAFAEWMMGLPVGWVTDVDGLTRGDQLKAIGNGVVPQQAHAAFSWLLSL